MCLHVLLELCFADSYKAAGNRFTFEHFIWPVIHPDVGLEIRFDLHSVVTVVTLVWHLSSVSPLVPCQV